MEFTAEDRRKEERTPIDPCDKSYFLEFDMGERQYRFNPLNTSTGGMGMLVMDQDAEFLRKLHPGDRLEMKYTTPEANLLIKFELRHITRIKAGPFRGHYQVGLAL